MHPDAVFGADTVATLLPPGVIQQLFGRRRVRVALGVLRLVLGHAADDVARRGAGWAIKLGRNLLTVDGETERLAYLGVAQEGVLGRRLRLSAIDVLVRVGEVDHNPL